MFNEKDNISELIRRIQNNLKYTDYEIIFVDDSNLLGRIRLIHRENKLDYPLQ